MIDFPSVTYRISNFGHYIFLNHGLAKMNMYFKIKISNKWDIFGGHYKF